ncbi:MAG: helicase-exonuclease AddAB subunit AddA [Oscillospiraceae bacterium]
MASLKFTKHQQEAIDVTNGNILVSAAAGSGKTAVLTQRVIKLLTGENPIPADKLVIVTYTVAAANEMRRRISDKLAEKIEGDPTNRTLQSQQLLLANAKISSIHSLCSSLIRDNFQILGVSSDIKIADETELNLIKNDAINEVLEKYYDENESDFLELVEFTCTRDDKKLISLILSIYNFIRSFSFPLSFLDESEQMYTKSPSIEHNIWTDFVSVHIIDALSNCIGILEGCIDDMSIDEIVMDKYSEAFSFDIVQLKYIKGLLQSKRFADASQCMVDIEKVRLGVIRKYEDAEFLDYLKDRRKKVYFIVDNIKEKYMSFSEADFEDDVNILKPKIKILFCIVREVYTLIEQKKQDANIIDYSDLEHFAVKLLVNRTENGYKKTDIAYELSDNIEQIMIDECQDINEVQNLIFKLLSKDETNIFMVGDVKQSIYRFRQAMPKLFMDKKKQFPVYNEEKHTNTSNGTITLESNFRSRKEVCDVVNYIFSQIMSEDIGEINYNDDEKLIVGASYEDKEDVFPEVHIIDYTKDNDDQKSIVEARYVAKMIKKMVADKFQVIDGDKKRACKYKDFAILLRKKKDISTTYANELIANGVPCFSDTSEGYFAEYEIMVILNLLKVIDNPLLDVSLLSVLMSPMFGFSADKVTRIRLAKKNTPLYLALSKLALSGDIECQQFIEVLSHFRQKASLLPTDEIIQEIYDKTDFIAIANALGNGEKKNANLRLMLSYAKKYERIGTNGLSGFIRYIDRVIDSKQDFSCANTTSKNANTVSIMSIHSSKGLEFPICIVGDCAKGFNKQEINTSPYQMNAELGFSMKITQPENLKSYTSLPFEAIKLKREKETISEEMRVLYVALTRAKEKLIMVMTFENAENKIRNIVDSCSLNEKPSPYEVYSYNNFASWIISALIRHPNFDNIRKEIGRTSLPIKCADFKVAGYIVKTDKVDAEVLEKQESTAVVSDEIADRLLKAFSFQYENAPLTQIPAKLTVTQIAKQANTSEVVLKARPSFMQKQKITPAERGTILHNFMQFANFANAKNNLVGEITRLVEQGYLTKEQADALNIVKIEAFLNSSLYQRMIKGDMLREYKFNFFIKAGEVDEKLKLPHSEAEIFIQGIADCLIIEDDGIVIVDYKTDYVDNDVILINRYYDQLRLYKSAIEEIFGRNVKQCLLYSLHLEKEIEISV